MARSSSAIHLSSVVTARSLCAREPGIRKESVPSWQENALQTWRETSLPSGRVLPRSRDALAARVLRRGLSQDAYPQAPSIFRPWSILISLLTAAIEPKSTLPAGRQPPAYRHSEQTPRQTIWLPQNRALGLKPTGLLVSLEGL